MNKVILVALQQTNLDYLERIKTKSLASTVRQILVWFFSSNKKIQGMRIDDKAQANKTFRLSEELTTKINEVKLFSLSYTVNSIIDIARKAGYKG
jgi:hypothetical protein